HKKLSFLMKIQLLSAAYLSKNDLAESQRDSRQPTRQQSAIEIATKRADQELTHILKDALVRSQVRFFFFPSIFRQFCGDEGDRTLNLRLAKPALSQLSYVP